MKKTAVIYIHGKGGSADEAAHYKPLFNESDVIGFDYRSLTPWDAKEEFPPFLDRISREHEAMILIANSIGAYFAMHSLSDRNIAKAFLISPIVDMEKLILQMMAWANVTEKDLQQQQEIATPFGETLSWSYLCYVRANPIRWTVPTQILYGEKDELTPYTVVSAFARRIGAGLTVMKDGEHWFHTKRQMAFLDSWLTCNI